MLIVTSPSKCLIHKGNWGSGKFLPSPVMSTPNLQCHVKANFKSSFCWDVLGGLMLKLKLQYFGHLMGRVDSLEKPLILGGIEGRRRRGWQRMNWLDGITDLMDMSLGEPWALVMYREAWHAAIHGVTKSQTRVSDWTELSNNTENVCVLYPGSFNGTFAKATIEYGSRILALIHTPIFFRVPHLCMCVCLVSYTASSVGWLSTITSTLNIFVPTKILCMAIS